MPLSLFVTIFFCFQLGPLQSTYFCCYFNVPLLCFLFLHFISLNTIKIPSLKIIFFYENCVRIYIFLWWTLILWSCLSWEFHTSKLCRQPYEMVVDLPLLGLDGFPWFWSAFMIICWLWAPASCRWYVAWNLCYVPCVSYTPRL